MQNQDDNFWGDPIHSYSRAEAIADGMLMDLSRATTEGDCSVSRPDSKSRLP